MFLEIGSFMEEFGITVLAWLVMILDLLTGAAEGVVAIFWDTTLGFTVYGFLLIFGLAMSFVMLMFGFIQKLIRK